MNIPIQLKINLTPELQDLLESKASKFGVPLTQYVKHVLMKDVEDEDYPIFKASAETEQAAKLALEELDQAVGAKDFFNQLNEQSFSTNKQSFSTNKQSFSTNKQSFSTNKQD